MLYKIRNCRISILGTGQLLGAEDGMLGQAYKTTVTCLSKEAEVMFAKTNEFLPKVRAHEDTWEMLTNNCLTKKKTDNQKLNRISKVLREDHNQQEDDKLEMKK